MKKKPARKTVAKRSSRKLAAPKKAAKRPAPKAKRKPAPKPPRRAAPKPAPKPAVRAVAPRPAPKRPTGPKPIPDGYHTVTPYLACAGAGAAIDFYKRAFGATETVRMPGPGGVLMHAEIKIGDSIVMLSDEMPGSYVRSPAALGGTSFSAFLYVPDVDASVVRAVKAGATVVMPPADMFWGDRFGKVRDPWGHEWAMATHKEDVPPAEMGKRAAAAAAEFAQQSASRSPAGAGGSPDEPTFEPPPEAA